MRNNLHKFIKTAILLTTTLGSMAFAVNEVNASTSYDKLYSTAKKYLGTPYVWGGTTPSGFDCSGYTQYVYKQSLNKSLNRTAQAQYDSTAKVSNSDVQKGDLVYFGYNTNNISHVGIYVGNGQMIDAQNNGVIIEQVNAPWWNKVGYSRPANLSENSETPETPENRGVKYSNVSMKMRVTGSQDFYNHVLGDSKYTRKLSNKGSDYTNKIVTIDNKGTVDSNGDIYYRCYYNGKNIGWVASTGLDNNAKYNSTTMQVKVNGSHDFYDHMSGDTKYARKLINKGSDYSGKMVDINCRGVVTSNGSIYYRATYNGKNIGWIYKTGLDTNVSYKNVSKTMTVTGKRDFYNHTDRDTRYVRKLTHKGSEYVGKKVTIDCSAKVKDAGSVFYRAYYNGKNIGWVYEPGLK